MTQAGNKYKLDPNLLVGLGMRESSLNPSQSNGGLFQIQDPKAYGIDPKDIGNFGVQIPAAAANLSGNISHFYGNVDLGIAAWMLGRGGTTGAGFVSPQIGISYTYSWKIFDFHFHW